MKSILTELLKAQFLSMRNSATKFSRPDWIRITFFGALSVAFVIAVFLFFEGLLGFIMAQEDLGGLRVALIMKLLNMVFLIFFLMLVYSSIVSSISTFYLSEDLDFLFSAPINVRSIFYLKFINAYVSVSWMLVVFGAPILAAHGLTQNAGVPYYMAIPPCLILFCFIPVAIGAGIGILLMLVFSGRKAQRTLVFLGLTTAVGLIAVFRLLKPEQVVNPVRFEQLTLYLEKLRAPTSPYLPGAWISEAMMAIIENSAYNFARFSVYMIAAALILFFVVRILADRYYYSGWARRGTMSGRASPRTASGMRITSRSPIAALMKKELLCFIRDPSQWAQVFILTALIIVYQFNFHNLPLDMYEYKGMMAYVNLAGSGLILAAVIVRFTYTSIAAEGRAVWTLLVSPIKSRTYIAGKYFMHVIPITLAGLVLVLAANRALKLPIMLNLRVVEGIFLISTALVATAIGMAARNPPFDVENPARVAVGGGAILYMIFASLFVAFIVAAGSLPDILRFFPQTYRWRRVIGDADIYIAHAAQWTASFGILVISLRSAIKSWDRIPPSLTL